MRWSKDQDVRILMLGLDSAGKVCPPFFLLTNVPFLTVRLDKTTILYRLQV
jgi:hypothetical protein